MSHHHRTASRIALAAAMMLCLGMPVAAHTVDHSKMDTSGAATPAYQDAMDAMMKNMMIPHSGNADVDFVRGMIPHHQGAVNKAPIVLEFGTGPEVRKFAEGVVAAQEAEIKWLQDWLAKNGG